MGGGPSHVGSSASPLSLRKKYTKEHLLRNKENFNKKLRHTIFARKLKSDPSSEKSAFDIRSPPHNRPTPIKCIPALCRPYTVFIPSFPRLVPHPFALVVSQSLK